MAAPSEPCLQAPEWLKNLPLAPVYHPTLAEFQDPISYIHRIEPEASKYGICKIIPPVPSPAKKTTLYNFNRSLLSQTPNQNSKTPPTFTSQFQQIGSSSRNPRHVEKRVWQSEERYTFHQFEAKARQMEKTLLTKSGKKGFSALEFETLFWRADSEKLLTVELANGVPGSCFGPINFKKLRETGEATVGDTDWNLGFVSRSKGSLLRFMKEDIPGVSSPMIGLGMLLSWYGWHVEDHNLHSLNYLHMGEGRTWYGVPGDAAIAFEEVVRVQGYGGEVNPLVAFSVLNEQTTVMSPEVLIRAGIPCCRLVQNAEEFVVTFPRAYHSGFNHGFNCDETANIATPEWLRVAKEAAIRRASVNYAPLVSHFQLLYALALSSSLSVSRGNHIEPRSSRLKDKNRSEAEKVIKKLFVQAVIHNNEFLHALLEEGSSCVLLPQNDSACSDSCTRSEVENSSSQNDGLLDQNLFSCVTCGIMSFTCAAIIQPREAASQYFAPADCSFFSELIHGSVPLKEQCTDDNQSANSSELNLCSGGMEKDDQNDLFDVPAKVQSASYRSQVANSRVDVVSATRRIQKDFSSLDLLASVYGSLSDSEEEQAPEIANEKNMEVYSSQYSPGNNFSCDTPLLHPHKPDLGDEEAEFMFHRSSGLAGDCKIPIPTSPCTCASYERYGVGSSNVKAGSKNAIEYLVQNNLDNDMSPSNKLRSCKDTLLRYERLRRRPAKSLVREVQTEEKESCPADQSMYSTTSHAMTSCTPTSFGTMSKYGNVGVSMGNRDMSIIQRSYEDASRKHMFCLEHAIEVEKQLVPKGGGHLLLLCHPDYPRVEAEAKLLAVELGVDYIWKDITFKEASKGDEQMTKSVLAEEKATPQNGDWTVKLGMNLRYSANLSLSPRYSRTIPYNSVIYEAFGLNSPTTEEANKKKKISFAGKWCGKVWLSNQVHPYLAQRKILEQETMLKSRSSVKPEATVEKKEAISHLTKQLLVPTKNTPQSVTATVACKAGLKRKQTSLKKETKKVKYAQPDGPIKVAEEPSQSSSSQCGRVLRSASKKREVPPLRNVIMKNNRQSDVKNNRQSDVKVEDESDVKVEEKIEGGPSTRLRKRPLKLREEVKAKRVNKKKIFLRRISDITTKEEEGEFQCNLDGCKMKFSTKKELTLHMRNICLDKGCKKKMLSHKYLVQHMRVHNDDRPLKCPWNGCRMTFKWAWSRTEHIRVHTGARPYVCEEPGCNQTFRFVSDFSRHRRKTGHDGKKEKE